MDEMLILANGSLPPMPFEERVAAAAGAGFDAIGLSVWEVGRLLAEGYSEHTMRTVLDDHGIRLAELEVVLGFAASEQERRREPIPGIPYTDRAAEQRIFEIGSAFGVRHVQVVGTFGTTVLEDDAAEKFAALCDRAAAHDLLIALEFVPGTSVPDAGTAARIASAADRPNGGLCVDVWHHVRGAADDELIRAIPPERVVMIQFDDGPAQPVDPDYVTDTMRYRQAPGDGAFDLVGFLHLFGPDVDAPVSVEVLSDDLATRPADEVATLLATTSRKVLAAAAR